MTKKLTSAVVILVALFVLLQIALPPERRNPTRSRPRAREPRAAASVERDKRREPLFRDRTTPAGLRVTRMEICRGIEGMEPVEVGTRFPAGVGSLYCFTVVEGASGPQVIYHEWQYGGGKVTSVQLSVEDEIWRTWSKKSIRPSQVGAWQVKVRDSQGRLLGETRFEIVADWR